MKRYPVLTIMIGVTLAFQAGHAQNAAGSLHPSSGVVQAIRSSGVGQELKIVEEGVLAPDAAQPQPSESAKEALAEQLKPAIAAENSAAADLDTTKESQAEASPKENAAIPTTLHVKGDEAWLRSIILDVSRPSDGTAFNLLQTKLTLEAPTLSRLRLAAAEVQEVLVNRGFYLGSVSVKSFNAETGVVEVHVDAGRVGRSVFVFEGREEGEDGRYFSQKQLQRALGRVQASPYFNYNEFYADIYQLNVHPDLVVNTDFNVRNRQEENVRRRDIDMMFTVEESLPIHSVLSINNYGTDATGNWQGAFTLQHLNLTKNDDVLTFNIPFSIDIESLRSAAASYAIPHQVGLGGRVTTYGGYSELNADEVVESIDIDGTGWFAGLQYSQNLVENDRHLVSASLGIVRRFIEDQLIVDKFETEPRNATVMPYTLALSYTQVQPGFLGGRNMATLQGIHNLGGLLGSSEDDEIQTLRPAADSEYMIGRLQVARIQPVFGRPGASGANERNWILFFRGEGQVADGALIPAEQLGSGGARSVRGYLEREFSGDDGFVANLEFRTPLLLGLFTRLFNSEVVTENPVDRTQFLIFADAGHTRIQDPLPNESDQQTVYSVGLGFRIGITDNFQIRADWGFPLEETSESSRSGTGHLEIQFQF